MNNDDVRSRVKASRYKALLGRNNIIDKCCPPVRVLNRADNMYDFYLCLKTDSLQTQGEN